MKQYQIPTIYFIQGRYMKLKNYNLLSISKSFIIYLPPICCNCMFFFINHMTVEIKLFLLLSHKTVVPSHNYRILTKSRISKNYN